MKPRFSINKMRSALTKYLKVLVALITIVGSWVIAHYLKNLYLGEYADYDRHRIATVYVSYMLIIATIVFIKCYLKELAFTLVELAIVLVIIGFIAAGISGGLLLIQNARYLSIINETTQYSMAMTNFRTRYNAYPGDFAFAFNTFGAVNGALMQM